MTTTSLRADSPRAGNRPTTAPPAHSSTVHEPPWTRVALIALLVATFATYTWDLAASGWANSFYSAAAQAGSESWQALFYGSSDAGNSITVDKPPASLWVMAISVRVFGLSSWSILIPQALMGVATVAVLYATVKRYAGARAGLLAGLIMATTPVAALMFRFNNPDALLVLIMTVAAWATLRAIERGAIRWFVLAGLMIGLGFLTKTLQVLLVVPFLGIAFLICANTTVGRRITGAVAGSVAAVLAAGWWVAIVELVPESLRPYIGGSQTNSFLELTFGYNGLGRINGEETGSVGGAAGWGTPGLTRMFTDLAAGQISWLLPAALLALVAGLAWRARAPRTDLRRAAYLAFGGWLIITGLTFSLMAGIFHDYYTVALAPAIAALVALGATDAWERRGTWRARIVLAIGLALTSAWSFILLSQTEAYGEWLRLLVLGSGLVGTIGLLMADQWGVLLRRATIATALIAALAGPVAWTATTVATPHTGSIVTAGPTDVTSASGRGAAGPGAAGPGAAGPGAARTGPGGPGAGGQTAGGQAAGGTGAGAPGGGQAGGLLDAAVPDAELVQALQSAADSYTWVAAAIGSQNAAGLQLGSGESVMSIGGFNGSDPSPTLEQFQDYVADGEIHYFVESGDSGPGGGRGGGPGGADSSGTGTEISEWVTASFASVTIGDQVLYDLTQPLTDGAGTAGTGGTA